MFRHFLALGCVVVLGLPVMVPSAGVAADAECQREVVLGTSRLGSPIVACQLRGSDPAVKRPLLVVGSMHGTETAGMDVVSRLMQRDVTGLGANVWVVRTVNPDGVAAGSRGNARGVDVDANFPTTGWKQRAKGTADWGGPKAASEPETRALMKAVSKLRPKQAVVFHQDLGMINCPPYRSKSLAKRLHALTGYPYKCLPGLAGSFTAWANQQYSSTSALTFDLEASPPAERLDGVAAALVTLTSTSPGPPPGAGTPTAPTAGADTGAVVRGQSVTIDVLANDRGANGELVAPGLAVITAPRNGRAEVQDADGPGPTRPQVTYTPSLDAPATDSFTYRLTEAGQTADASVTLSVANAAPTAGDDSAKVRSNAGVVIQVPVLDNDADPDGGTLVITEVGAPEHGTASVNGNTISYDPTDGYVGPDGFTYRISDGQGATAQARVTMKVRAPRTTLTPVPDEVATAPGLAVRIDVLANDSGGTAPLQVVKVSTAKAVDTTKVVSTAMAVGTTKAVGRVTLARDRRTVIFKPRRAFAGTATFTYTVRDKRGTTAQARVNVTVAATPPAADSPTPTGSASAVIPNRLVLGREYRIDVSTGGFAQDAMDAEVQKRTGTAWQTVTTGTLAATGGSIPLAVTPTLAPLTSTARTASLDLRVRVTASDGTTAHTAPTSVQVATDISAEVSGPLQRADVPFSYRPGCPVGPESLRRVTLNYWDYTGAQARGSLIAHADAIADLTSVFTQAFNAGFRIKAMTPVDAYYDSGQRSPTDSDHASMAQSNTSAFNCRPVVGNPTKLSAHSYGIAIDINPFENPYAVAGAVYPTGSAKYLTRTPCRTGMICTGGVIATAMQAVGWPWGARWSKPDYQHFSLSGR